MWGGGCSARSRPAASAAGAFPSVRVIALFAVLLGLASFLVRTVLVMDEFTFEPLNLQLPFFVQYIALFVVGLVAYRRNWFVSLPDKTGRLWLRIAVVLILLWPPMMIVNGAIDDAVAFKGGWHWESLVYALWEASLCVSMCIGLIYAFRRYLDRRGRVAAFLVPNAYTAYIIHAPVIATLASPLRARRSIRCSSGLQWRAVAVPLCFGLSSLIRKLPYTDRVL